MRLWIDRSGQTYAHLCDSMEAFRRKTSLTRFSRAVVRVLLGQDARTYFRFDLHGNVDENLLQQFLGTFQLDPGQDAFVKSLRSIPNGIKFLVGPPGTGKTTCVVAAVLPYVLTMGDSSIIFSAPSNEAVDRIAQAFVQQIDTKEYRKMAEDAGERAHVKPIVTRLYNQTIEEHVLMHKLRGPKQKGANLQELMDPQVTTERLNTDHLTYQISEQLTRMTAGSRDKRYKLNPLAENTRMLQFLGLIPGNPPEIHYPCASCIRNMIKQRQHDDDFSQEDEDELQDFLRGLKM